MKPLILIFAIALGGLAFSGYLTYRELFATAAGATCTPLGEPGTPLGAPPCVYGFFMYLAIAILTAFAMVRRRRSVG